MLQPVLRGGEPASGQFGEEALPPAKPTALLDLSGLRAILRRRTKVAIATALLTLAAVLLYILLVPPRFQATSVLLSDPREERVVPSENVLPGIGADVAAVESQVELLTSTELIKRVMEELDLFNDPEFTQPSFITRIKQRLTGARPKGGAEEVNAAIERFRKALDVSRRGLTYVLEVSFTSDDAVKSAKVANAVSDTYLDDQIKQKKQATASAGDMLKSRIDELRDKVKSSERAVADFKAQHGIIDVGADKSGLRLDRQQLDQVNQQLVEARAALASATAKVEQMKRLVDDSGDLEELAAVQDSPIIQELRKQYAQVLSLEASYAETLGPSHPTLMRLRSQKASLRAELNREAKRVLAAAINEQEAARKKEISFSASLDEMTKQLEQNDRNAVQLQELQRQADADNALYTQFLNRAKEVAEQESLQRPDARLISRATPPTRPTGPGKGMLLSLGVVGGLILGLLAAFAADQLDSSYRTRSQLEEDLGIPCLALCPYFTPSKWRSVSKTEALFIESIHLLRHEIQISQAKRPVVVLLTSSLQGEGKSTIARALAESASRSSQRTLLIDADARAQSLSKRMAPRAKYGLLDVLRGDFPADEVLLSQGDWIKIMPAGRPGKDPTEPSFKRIASLWEAGGTSYDLVVIDAAPVLASVEPVLLQEHVDLVLLVVAWGRTSRDDVEAACDIIRRGHRSGFGAVLNKVDPKAMRSSSYV